MASLTEKESKYVRRQKKRLKARVDAYNTACKSRSDNGRGIHKPGCGKMKRN